MRRDINLDFTTSGKAARSLREIADEVEAERAVILSIAHDPKNTAVLVFTLLGVAKDG